MVSPTVDCQGSKRRAPRLSISIEVTLVGASYWLQALIELGAMVVLSRRRRQRDASYAALIEMRFLSLLVVRVNVVSVLAHILPRNIKLSSEMLHFPNLFLGRCEQRLPQADYIPPLYLGVLTVFGVSLRCCDRLSWA
jgi:hypothetical protein